MFLSHFPKNFENYFLLWNFPLWKPPLLLIYTFVYSGILTFRIFVYFKLNFFLRKISISFISTVVYCLHLSIYTKTTYFTYASYSTSCVLHNRKIVFINWSCIFFLLLHTSGQILKYKTKIFILEQWWIECVCASIKMYIYKHEKPKNSVQNKRLECFISAFQK